MQNTEFTCPQRRNEFWQTKSKPSLCTSLYTIRMRCESCQRKWGERCSQDNRRLGRTRWNTPKYLRAFGKPRVICRRGTLTQFLRESHLAGRGDTRTSSTCKEWRNSSMMLSQSRSIISLPKSSSKRSKSTNHMSWWSSRSSIGQYWSYTIGKGPYKGIIENQEIRKVGLSETHASGNREASIHNDWWKANWWHKYRQERSRLTWNDEVWDFVKGS